MHTTDNQQEPFIVVDRHDRIVGYRTRYECHHNKNLIHRGANLVIFDGCGRTLLQKRSMTKDTEPGSWQHAVGGHVSKGESYKQAMQREMKEELGLTVQVRLYKKFLFAYAHETEMEAVFIGESTGPFYPNHQEVDEVRFVSKDELQKSIQSGDMRLTELAHHIFRFVGYV